ncbi:MAG: hypothetical protein L0206_21255, partial [Actinobacteria bacterium]|nr:hypothetical protein [Actinomycetota bacterium]
EAGIIAGIAEELAARTGLPDDVAVAIEVDEELPLPLTGSAVAVDDSGVQLWFSGANFENGKHRGSFDEPTARSDLANNLFRARDRLQSGFAGAPPDEELSDAQRGVWDAWAEGRTARLGEFVRRVRRQYQFRLYNGFTDVADAAFDRLWSGDDFSWDELEAIRQECAAADPRPAPKRKSAIRKESLRQ